MESNLTKGDFYHPPGRRECHLKNITLFIVTFNIFIGKQPVILVTVMAPRSRKGYTMEETITFWLDNKISSGFKIAEIGAQTLVLYRDKYYIVTGGAAQMKGVRPLHFSKTSLPLIWKKAMKGILPPVSDMVADNSDELLPATTSTKKERTTMQKSAVTVTDFSDEQPFPTTPSAPTPKRSSAAKPSAEVRPVKIAQNAVSTICPHWSHKQAIPFEKGKNGKPFFTACPRCNSEFAVRFVPVTIYQAQVAAFK